jgi:hypothetical protein
MLTRHTQTTVPGPPADVLDLLTEPDAIARWAPIPFEILELDTRRLVTGSRARVAGRLAGRSVEFEVLVLEAHHRGLDLIANGPISLTVKYCLQPSARGSEVHASVSVDGHGLLGRLLAKATDALLATGALRNALERLGQELQAAPAPSA